MEITSLKSENSDIARAVNNPAKLKLDLFKSQSIGVLPQFMSGFGYSDFVLSSSLLNQINDAKLVTPQIVRNYQSKIDDALKDLAPVEGAAQSEVRESITPTEVISGVGSELDIKA